MAVNGKKKGSGFERDIAKKLSLSLTDGKETHAIWRTAASGGIATIHSKKGKKSEAVKRLTGDLSPIIESGLYPKLDNFFNVFFVETKFYKLLDLWPPSALDKFWDQIIEEKKSSHKLIFFVVKANRKRALVFTETIFNTLKQKMIVPIHKNTLLNVYYFEEVLEHLFKDYMK